MLTQQTVAALYRLRLVGMAEAFEQQLAQPDTHDLSFEERCSLLVDREATYRESKRLQRLLKRARLRQPQACAEDIDYRHPRGLEKRQMASLVTGDWVRAHQNVCITGPTGCGKTWLACALGNQACRQGHTVLYVRRSRLMEELRLAHGDGSFSRRLSGISRRDRLILDDWGLKPLAQAERHDLLEIMEDRHGNRATLVTSQLPVEKWHEYLGDPTLADAIMDRLVHNAYKLPLRGESMRKTKGRHEWIGTHEPSGSRRSLSA